MIQILLIELERSFKEFKSYRVNMLLANVSVLLLFVGLLTFSDSEIPFEVKLFSTLLWYVSFHGISNPVYTIEEEFLLGTIVNISLAKRSLYFILSIRMFVQILIDILKVIVIYVLLSVILNVSYTFYELLTILFLIIFVTIITYFVGIIFAAYSLRFKKISEIVSVFYYVLLFFFGAYFTINNKLLIFLNSLFPFQYFNTLIDDLIAQGEFSFEILMILCLQAIVYFTISIFVLNSELTKVRKKGGLEHV